MKSAGESRFKRAASGVGGYAIGLILLLLLLLVTALLLRGMVWASEKLMPWLITASSIALIVCIFILLPMSAFRTSRPWAGVGYYYASFVFGIMVLAYSCLFTVFTWGYGALVLGLIIGGVGVVPVALLAAIFHAEWSVLWELVSGIVLTFGTRAFGAWLIYKAERAAEAERLLADY